MDDRRQHAYRTKKNYSDVSSSFEVGYRVEVFSIWIKMVRITSNWIVNIHSKYSPNAKVVHLFKDVYYGIKIWCDGIKIWYDGIKIWYNLPCINTSRPKVSFHTEVSVQNQLISMRLVSVSKRVQDNIKISLAVSRTPNYITILINSIIQNLCEYLKPLLLPSETFTWSFHAFLLCTSSGSLFTVILLKYFIYQTFFEINYFYINGFIGLAHFSFRRF